MRHIRLIIPALRRAGDKGMATAEYAACLVAVVGFAGLLYKVLTSSTVMSELREIVTSALDIGS